MKKPLCRLTVAATLAAFAALLPATAAAADLAKGNRIYMQHCANCHGPRGQAVNPGVPNFYRGEGLVQPDMMLLQTVKIGRKGQPPFFGILSDQDILDALAYSRMLR
jgi:cytochrome c6